MEYESKAEEIIDMLHLQYEDEPADEGRIMAYLANLGTGEYVELSRRASWRLEEMERCPYCGTKLCYKIYYESHPEIAYRADSISYVPQEKMAMEYCPECEPEKGDF